MRSTLAQMLRSALDACSHRLPRSLAIALDLIQADPEDADVIRGAQVDAIVRVSPLVVGASCFNALIVLGTFAAMGALQPAYLIWAVVLFALAARYSRAAWRRRKSARRTASRRTIRRMVLNGAAFGALWGVIPAVTFPGAPPAIQLFVACVTCGMMSAGGFVLAAVPLAGMSYVAMMAAGALFALLREGSPVALGIMALLASYTAVIVVAINWNAVLLINSLLAQAQVRREVAAREQAQAQTAHAERMTALGQLAGGIAHDFNNILQVVSGGAARIERNPENREGVVRQALRIQDAVERGSAISRRLLAFARRDALNAEPIDVAALLADLGELLAYTIGPSIRIHVDVAMAWGRLIADRRQLETVILNLATNARDAMPSGGELTIVADTLVLEHDCESPRLKPGRYVRIVVRDTGTGISSATMARVAEPFFTTKPKGMGTGLGLPMAKGFAEQSGGAFAIASEPGRGTTVTLWLPQADASVLAQAKETAHDFALVAVGERRCVLLVDDDELVREVLMTSLEDVGFVMLAAENAKRALALLDQGADVDALVTDFSMPGMNGLELIREVHARKPDLPTILLTGHVGEVAAQSADEQRAQHFTLLQKPMKPEHIAQRLVALIH
jgi:signal transduction histidine kinase